MKASDEFETTIQVASDGTADYSIHKRTRTHIVAREAVDDGALAALPAVDDSAVAQPTGIAKLITPRKSVVLIAVVLLLALAGIVAGLWLSRRKPPPVTPAEVKTLAILPFRETGATEDRYLGLGLADALITELSNVRRVVVRPTSAVRKYAEAESVNVAVVGRELNVEALLEGNIQRANDRLRVTVQLLRVTDGTPIWGQSFDEKLTDILTVQNSAGKEFQRALALNPNYATAPQWYGMYLYRLARFDEALAAIKRAQELDPLSPSINSSLGVCLCYARRYDDSIEQYRKVLNLNPNSFSGPLSTREGPAAERSL